MTHAEGFTKDDGTCCGPRATAYAAFFKLGVVVFSRVMLLAIVVSSLFVGPSDAAITFERMTLPGDMRALVVSGEFEISDDPVAFAGEVAQFKPAFITFRSGGGNVVSAMKIGRMIRALGISTLQIRSAECASACALAFVGGVRRSAEAGSIGVHQASFSDDAALDSKTAVTAVQAMTAEIIGYLSEMGVSPQLLQLSLSVESSDMRYLTSSEMTNWGVTTPGSVGGTEVASRPPSDPPQAPTASPSNGGSASTQSENPSQAALAFVARYHEAWSLPNTQAMAFMRQAYADNVDFYGKQLSISDVLKDKETFAERWPDRAYSVRYGSQAVRCIVTCQVTGTVEWFSRSVPRGKVSSGVADFEVVWDPKSKKILAESSKVLRADKGSKEPSRLISQWEHENGTCRGSSGDNPETWKACERREAIGAKLDKVGWCYGRKGEAGYQHQWHACDRDSDRQ
ncbi:hypothetical protein E0H93_32180 [Rhizobium leguminosarum bv. viciae]|uniref:COG3904 family protein n=1 Tax=Rhizobium leguminosarum TaxID=384 RepID=UPI000FEC9301|nr:hypothetical protein [Rhizobium leguminosarum]RWX40272.1 hypothetical protein EHH54_13120 [Rhizobium leguminosarum]TBY21711.1 hypothetical protein E0H55_34210 [Rhizobium leguminosarum bv. viciae]TCA96786.1 hypothetical protein E0H93_32180 [Rhizobium leguminosarum bv. viciae]